MTGEEPHQRKQFDQKVPPPFVRAARVLGPKVGVMFLCVFRFPCGAAVECNCLIARLIAPLRPCSPIGPPEAPGLQTFASLSASRFSQQVRQGGRGIEAGTEGGGGGGGAYSFVACLNRLTIDHAFLWRRGTVPTPYRDTSDVWALISCFPRIT